MSDFDDITWEVWSRFDQIGCWIDSVLDAWTDEEESKQGNVPEDYDPQQRLTDAERLAKDHEK
eukprot:9823798-Prorocentrum_lima.AAC.1